MFTVEVFGNAFDGLDLVGAIDNALARFQGCKGFCLLRILKAFVFKAVLGIKAK